MTNFFQHHRNARGIDIKEVSKELKISEFYLRAIESDDFAKLPGDVYARGYIKEYARFLGIDAEDALNGYTNYLQRRDHSETTTACPISCGESLRGSLKGRRRRTDTFFRVVSAMMGLLVLYLFLPERNTFTHMVSQSIDSVASREKAYHVRTSSMYTPPRTFWVSRTAQSNKQVVSAQHVTHAGGIAEIAFERDDSTISRPADPGRPGVDDSEDSVIRAKEAGTLTMWQEFLVELCVASSDRDASCGVDPECVGTPGPRGWQSLFCEAVQMTCLPTDADASAAFVSDEESDLKMLPDDGLLLTGLTMVWRGDAVASFLCQATPSPLLGVCDDSALTDRLLAVDVSPHVTLWGY